VNDNLTLYVAAVVFGAFWLLIAFGIAHFMIKYW
jgi:hypothetical protein